jgi:hypothetical protein
MVLCVATLGLGLPPPRGQWCARVREARAGVPPQLHVEVPCETMEATSVAVVSYLCDSLSQASVQIDLIVVTHGR